MIDQLHKTFWGAQIHAWSSVNFFSFLALLSCVVLNGWLLVCALFLFGGLQFYSFVKHLGYIWENHRRRKRSREAWEERPGDKA